MLITNSLWALRARPIAKAYQNSRKKKIGAKKDVTQGSQTNNRYSGVLNWFKNHLRKID